MGSTTIADALWRKWGRRCRKPWRAGSVVTSGFVCPARKRCQLSASDAGRPRSAVSRRGRGRNIAVADAAPGASSSSRRAFSRRSRTAERDSPNFGKAIDEYLEGARLRPSTMQLTVRMQLERGTRARVEPKTGDAVRQVPLPAFVVKELMAHRLASPFSLDAHPSTQTCSTVRGTRSARRRLWTLRSARRCNGGGGSGGSSSRRSDQTASLSQMPVAGAALTLGNEQGVACGSDDRPDYSQGKPKHWVGAPLPCALFFPPSITPSMEVKIP